MISKCMSQSALSRDTDHDLPINLAANRSLLPPRPSRQGVKDGPVLPARVDVEFLVFLELV